MIAVQISGVSYERNGVGAFVGRTGENGVERAVPAALRPLLLATEEIHMRVHGLTGTDAEIAAAARAYRAARMVEGEGAGLAVEDARDALDRAVVAKFHREEAEGP